MYLRVHDIMVILMDNNGDPHGDILRVRHWRSWENGMTLVTIMVIIMVIITMKCSFIVNV